MYKANSLKQIVNIMTTGNDPGQQKKLGTQWLIWQHLPYIGSASNPLVISIKNFDKGFIRENIFQYSSLRLNQRILNRDIFACHGMVIFFSLNIDWTTSARKLNSIDESTLVTAQAHTTQDIHTPTHSDFFLTLTSPLLWNSDLGHDSSRHIVRFHCFYVQYLCFSFFALTSRLRVEYKLSVVNLYCQLFCRPVPGTARRWADVEPLSRRRALAPVMACTPFCDIPVRYSLRGPPLNGSYMSFECYASKTLQGSLSL